MSHAASLRLRAKLDLVMPDLLARTGEMWRHPTPELYRAWLRVLHGMVRATVPLVLDATTACLSRDDRIAGRLACYLTRHVHEEYGHDLDVVRDYAAAGGDRDALLNGPQNPAVAAIVGCQYYWIRHVHPVALLGHIAVLEGYPPPAGLAPFLARHTGLPQDAFSTLTKHASLDGTHREELWRAIDGLPLTPGAEALIGLSALTTIQGLARLVDTVQAKGTPWPPSTSWKPPVST